MNDQDRRVKDRTPFLHHPSYGRIQFQEGPIKEVGVNGWQIEEVIQVLIDRLKGFQHGEFPCRQNALAITKLEEAKMWLDNRTAEREAAGVEGLSKPVSQQKTGER